MNISQPITGSVRRKLGVAAHLAAMSALGANDVGSPVLLGSGRSHFGQLYQRGGALAHTLAFDDDFAVLPEAEFQEKVIGEVGKVAKKILSLEEKQAEILKAMPKDIKAELETIEKLKRSANDQQANIEKLLRAIGTFDEKIRLHARLGFGNPIQRIQSDPEMRCRLNLAVRLACSKAREMVPDRLAAQLRRSPARPSAKTRPLDRSSSMTHWRPRSTTPWRPSGSGTPSRWTASATRP
jgi:hypothetical protein